MAGWALEAGSALPWRQKEEGEGGTDAGKFVDFMVEIDGVFLGLLTSLGSRRCDHPLDCYLHTPSTIFVAGLGT